MISERSKQIIMTWLQQWLEHLSRQAQEMVVNDCRATPEQLYDSPLGKTLCSIAAAAEGLLPAGRKAEVRETCREICKWTWAKPGTATDKCRIPWEEWSATAMGNLILQATLWAEDDELITMSEAEAISGRSLSDLSQRINRGKLQGYRDPHESNPQRATRVRRSEVLRLPKVRRRPGPAVAE